MTDRMQEQPQGQTHEWKIPVVTRVGGQTRYIRITVEGGQVLWSTPRYEYVFPVESEAKLIAAVVESRAAADDQARS